MSIAEKLTTIAENEQKVYNAGYEKGKFESGDTEEAYNNGFEDGKQSEYETFWEMVLENNNWGYRFAGKSWTDQNFKPIKNITPINRATGMFSETGIKDIRGICERLGIIIDLSNTTNTSTFFADSAVEYFGVMDLRKHTTLNSCLFNAVNLIEVDKVVLKDDGSQIFTSFANNCNNLTKIIFEGVIGKNISFAQSSKLTKESLDSIILALKDFSGTTTTATLTLHATAKAKLTEADIATITQKGWTLA